MSVFNKPNLVAAVALVAAGAGLELQAKGSTGIHFQNKTAENLIVRFERFERFDREDRGKVLINPFLWNHCVPGGRHLPALRLHHVRQDEDITLGPDEYLDLFYDFSFAEVSTRTATGSRGFTVTDPLSGASQAFVYTAFRHHSMEDGELCEHARIRAPTRSG